MPRTKISKLKISNDNHKNHLKGTTNTHTRLPKINISKTRILGKEVSLVQPVIKGKNSNYLSDIGDIIQNIMKENNMSPEDAIRMLGDKRYEK